MHSSTCTWAMSSAGICNTFRFIAVLMQFIRRGQPSGAQHLGPREAGVRTEPSEALRIHIRDIVVEQHSGRLLLPMVIGGKGGNRTLDPAL